MWGSGGIAPPFLTPTLDGGEGSASHTSCFIPGKKVKHILNKGKLTN
jgi:hypothetical protein